MVIKERHRLYALILSLSLVKARPGEQVTNGRSFEHAFQYRPRWRASTRIDMYRHFSNLLYSSSTSHPSGTLAFSMTVPYVFAHWQVGCSEVHVLSLPDGDFEPDRISDGLRCHSGLCLLGVLT
ncbi:hypothetical protein EI94DRAFT_1713651 [Lactarius quietus]|nr:hypothetical protein EI94DRAFT_1713651 [Lactarius quietus]